MSPEQEPGEGRPDDAVEELRTDIDHTRHEIDRTMTELEKRLGPDRMREMLMERAREWTALWREQPGRQLEGLSREMMTRLREMAWMNPAGLGVAAAAVGYLVGRRSAARGWRRE